MHSADNALQVRYVTSELGRGSIDIVVDGVNMEAKHGVAAARAVNLLRQFRRYVAAETPLEYIVPNQDVEDALMAIIDADEGAKAALEAIQEAGLWKGISHVASPWLQWNALGGQ